MRPGTGVSKQGVLRSGGERSKVGAAVFRGRLKRTAKGTSTSHAAYTPHGAGSRMQNQDGARYLRSRRTMPAGFVCLLVSAKPRAFVTRSRWGVDAWHAAFCCRCHVRSCARGSGRESVDAGQRQQIGSAVWPEERSTIWHAPPSATVPRHTLMAGECYRMLLSGGRRNRAARAARPRHSEARVRRGTRADRRFLAQHASQMLPTLAPQCRGPANLVSRVACLVVRRGPNTCGTAAQERTEAFASARDLPHA
jgi:hypothetical protein